MRQNQTDQQSIEPDKAGQVTDGGTEQSEQTEPVKPKIQLGNSAPTDQPNYSSTKSDASGNRPKVTMDMLEEESAPGPPSQTLVMGLQDNDDNTEETGQTLVTGPQQLEDKTQSAPKYMSASQVENKPKKHVLLKVALALFVLTLIGGGVYGVSLLLI